MPSYRCVISPYGCELQKEKEQIPKIKVFDI